MNKKKLLLHTCCAPCLIYVHHKLEQDYNYDITCFFYNPNIHPESEYRARELELIRIGELKGWKIVYAEYDPQDWFTRTMEFKAAREQGERCSLCFNIRLRRAFEYAAANGFDSVATTLSVSPYKVTAQIDAEGEKLSEEFGVAYLPENFKKQNGYNMAKQMAMELGIRYQDYCGCTYSYEEKQTRIKEKKERQEKNIG